MARFDLAGHGAVGVFLADRPRDNRLIIHRRLAAEKDLRQVAAMKHDPLVRVVAEIIVPIQQRARLPRRQRHRIHPDQPGNIGFARARLQRVAQHAHHRAGDDAEKFFHCRPALHRRADKFVIRDEFVQNDAEFRHFQQAFVANPNRLDIPLDVRQFRGHRRIIVAQFANLPENVGQIHAFDRNSGAFQQFFAVPHGDKRRRARPDLPKAGFAQAIHDAADSGEFFQILPETRGKRVNRVQPGQTVFDAVLHQVVARRHFAAETIAPVR